MSDSTIIRPQGVPINAPAVLPTRTFELHKWRKTRVEGAAAIEPPKSQAGEAIRLDWLAAAAEDYNVSADPRDYVIAEMGLVTADVPNRNMDCFSFVDLMKWNSTVGRIAYKTFIGKPTHENHDNKDKRKAKGVNFDSMFRKVKTRVANVKVRKVFVLSGFDRTKDRELARSILRGDRRAYSMGALVDLTVCSVCGQPTSGRRSCHCIGARKGQIVRGMLKYDLCKGINFIENSNVLVGADHTAVSDEWWGL